MIGLENKNLSLFNRILKSHQEDKTLFPESMSIPSGPEKTVYLARSMPTRMFEMK